MGRKITPGQIRELLNIDHQRGIRAELQELIARLIAGGVGKESDEPQAVPRGGLATYDWRAAKTVLLSPAEIDGTVLKLIRKALGFTQRELAAVMGIVVETVSRWETGAEPVRRISQLALAALVTAAEDQDLADLHVAIGGVESAVEDPRVVQAKRLWDKGFGRECEIGSAVDTTEGPIVRIASNFEDYLSTIPAIPEELKAHNQWFPLLVLVDTRLEISMICKLLNIKYSSGRLPKDIDCAKARNEKVYWIRAQNGGRNMNFSVSSFRKGFPEGEMGLTAHEGLAIFAQDHTVVVGHGMLLTDAITNDDDESAAYLEWFSQDPWLHSVSDDHTHPNHGIGSRRV